MSNSVLTRHILCFKVTIMEQSDTPGNALRAWRASRSGMSQLRFQQLSGIDRTRLSRIENGRQGPTLAEALTIARITSGAIAVESWEDRAAEKVSPDPKVAA